MLRYTTDRFTWFSRLVRHPARKWSGSILTTAEPARGATSDDKSDVKLLSKSVISLTVKCGCTWHFKNTSVLQARLLIITIMSTVG